MFHVGQLVACVDDALHNEWCPSGSRYYGGLDGLKKGKVYTIRVPFVPQAPGEGGSFGVYLMEIVRPPQTDGDDEGEETPFDASRFRPVRDESISVFRRIAASPRERIEVSA